MTDAGGDGDETFVKNGSEPGSQDASLEATWREEDLFGNEEDDNSDLLRTPDHDSPDSRRPSFSQLSSYPGDVDYYAVLGLPRFPPPSDAEIRSAFLLLVPSFHPDKHPKSEERARESYEKLTNAYDVLTDPQKRVVYDMVGEEGVQREWNQRGVMGVRGPNSARMLGIRAMNAKEFKTWFVERMRERERQVLETMVENRTHITFGLSAISVFPQERGVTHTTFKAPHIIPTTYNVRSSFNLPLPSYAHATCKVNTGIGGSLRRLEREIEYETAAGDRETRIYLMPFSVFTRSITLGLNGSFRVPENSGTSILRFLNGCDLDVGAAVLPSSVLRTAVTRSFLPVKGAEPFEVCMQTTYHENVFRVPPTVDFSVSRQLGPRQYGNIALSSGMWFWPSVLQDSVGQFVKLGARTNDTLQMTGHSNCRISFTSSAAYDDPAVNMDDSGAFSSDHSTTAIDKSGPLGEAWGLELGSSPFGAMLSINYGRNLFRGQMRPPAQSEWSKVEHHVHQSLSTLQPQAVRLDLQGSLSLDGSFGWMVKGSRAVGEFSRVGVGVGVQGPRGLVVSVSWNRLGQSINVPIAVCPLDLVNADVITAAIAIPWAIYTAFHYGVIQPQVKRRHKEAFSEKRKELTRLTRDRKAESRRDIELMTARVNRRQEVERERDGLIVLEATYGVLQRSRRDETTMSRKTTASIDVTIPVAALVQNSHLIIARGVNKSQILGFYDPAPLKSKALRIRYQFEGREHFSEVKDDETLTCPRESHML